MSTVISAVVGTILALKRRCPACGQEQIVPQEQRHTTVICTFCGAAIPPVAKRSS